MKSARYPVRTLLLCCLGAFTASVIAEPPEGKGRNRHQGKHEQREQSAVETLVSAGISVSVARQYAVDAGFGSAASKPLPPGIRKNLARGKPLPPGIARKVASPEMMNRLPQHPGYEWRVAGTDLILVQIGTAIIADVLRDVFR